MSLKIFPNRTGEGVIVNKWAFLYCRIIVDKTIICLVGTLAFLMHYKNYLTGHRLFFARSHHYDDSSIQGCVSLVPYFYIP